MANITLPRADIPFMLDDGNGNLRNHPEWIRAMSDLLRRTGGVSGPGTEDLTLSQFEDAGIEETKVALRELGSEFGQLPPAAQVPITQDDPDARLNALAAELTALREVVQGLLQGLSA